MAMWCEVLSSQVVFFWSNCFLDENAGIATSKCGPDRKFEISSVDFFCGKIQISKRCHTAFEK